MTLTEFERQVYAVAAASPICGDFIDVFFNEQTDTLAYAVIHDGKQVFGADNTGGWHIHPWLRPANHEALAGPMSFGSFVETVEKHLHNG